MHKFRLRTKRFRYTLEMFKDLYGPGMLKRIESLKQVQTYLGDINDCIVTSESQRHGGDGRYPGQAKEEGGEKDLSTPRISGRKHSMRKAPNASGPAILSLCLQAFSLGFSAEEMMESAIGRDILEEVKTGRSSNGKTAASGAAYRGSNPCLPATRFSSGAKN